ncbi:hypothetical protein [Thioalkalivibrio sp. ALJ16]|uniref:hypothetical protein n=1 Tax=Thioalkalivibrio sp. ALJ16 TaxID=1158762 RepID=UPI0003662CD4|nr:hypothetical protein [Thioalkalivibrio sp. ALJ16]
MLTLLPRLFQRAPALDPESRAWIQAVFDWSEAQPQWRRMLEHADLVCPTAAHFPGRADNAPEMAQLVFDRVLAHAGLADSPFRLAHAGALMDQPIAWDTLATPVAEAVPATGTVRIPYDPQLVPHSEALIAHFAREIALRLLPTAERPAPAAEDNTPHIAELLAVQLGFGIMLANTAFHVRVNQCGACKGPSAEREAALSRDDLAYALALFCRHKGIPPGRARSHLNAPLRAAFRHAVRDVARNKRTGASGAA